jgi:hypothetical protein
MWKLQLEGGINTKVGIYAGADIATPTNLANHIVIRDGEIAVLGGASPSYQGQQKPNALIHVPQNVLGTYPPTALKTPDYLGFERMYLHGNDPGDPSQIGVTGSTADASGNCLNWYQSGTVNTANTDASHGTITLTSFTPTLSYSNAAFGPTFTVGSTINIGGTFAGAGSSITGGTNYTISAFDPTASNTVLTINGQPGTQTGVQYLQVNPPSQYTPGCGDDVEHGITLNADNSWLEYSYIEKIHWWSGESHAASYGFDNGPTKIAHNWMEGGANTLFSGGAPSDSAGGPGSDNEIRGNYLGRDLNYRFLTGTSGASPGPPFGCGPLDGVWSHNTCPFLWLFKNSLESKVGHRNLVDGNIIENSWEDSQAGFCVLFNVEAGSGGEAVGIFDPITGLPASYLDNVRFSNNWVRNCPSAVQMIGRGDMNTGNSGGITLPTDHLDFIGNLFSNISDNSQFGNPGQAPSHIWQWGNGNGSSESYATCAMSYTGSSSPYTVTALCAPMQTDLTNPNHVSAITVDSSHNVTIAHSGIRADPTICQGSSATCVTNGQTIVIGSGITGNSITLTPGSYAMIGTSGNWATDGTGGTTIVYNDGTTAAGTVCSSSTTPCGTVIGSNTVTFASLGGKMMDIAPPNGAIPGDGVYATNLSGIIAGSSDTTCSTNGYATGATAANYAVAGTVQTGLTVKYNLTTAPSQSSATCAINNGAGAPRFVTLQGNTFLAVNVFDITPFTVWRQPISNYMHDNVFADNDALTSSDVYGGSPTREGTLGFASWDPASFQYYHNVMQGRSSANWSAVNCPGGTCTNAFPTTVNCSGSTADGTCLGYSGFMGSSPTVTYPSGACSNANAPFNCPLMALPWANNLTLSNLNYVGSSSYSTQGVNPGQLLNAMTQTKYVCPVGANCGTHGPYPD